MEGKEERSDRFVEIFIQEVGIRREREVLMIQLDVL